MNLGKLSALLFALPIVACGATTEEASTEATQNLGALRQFDHDFFIPPQSVAIQRAYSEVLTRYGVTARPSLEATGVFALSNGHVHVQAEHGGFPYRVARLDVLAQGDWSATARIDFDVAVDPTWSTYSADFRRRFATGTSIGGKAVEVTKVKLGGTPLPDSSGLELRVDLEVAVACELDFDAELHGFAEVGVGGLASIDAFYDEELPEKVGVVANGGLTPREQFHVTTQPFVSFLPANKANVHGHCSLEPSVNVLVAAVNDGAPFADAGVKVIVEPYADFTGTFHTPDDYAVRVKAGIAANISPFGDFFGHHWERSDYVTLFDAEL